MVIEERVIDFEPEVSFPRKWIDDHAEIVCADTHAWVGPGSLFSNIYYDKDCNKKFRQLLLGEVLTTQRFSGNVIFRRQKQIAMLHSLVHKTLIGGDSAEDIEHAQFLKEAAEGKHAFTSGLLCPGKSLISREDSLVFHSLQHSLRSVVGSSIHIGFGCFTDWKKTQTDYIDVITRMTADCLVMRLNARSRRTHAASPYPDCGVMLVVKDSKLISGTGRTRRYPGCYFVGCLKVSRQENMFLVSDSELAQGKWMGSQTWSRLFVGDEATLKNHVVMSWEASLP